MNSKKIIATSLLGASMLGTAIYSNNVIAHAEQENEEIVKTIRDGGVNPEHPELKSEINRFGVKQLELETLKGENNKLKTELDSQNQEKGLAEEKLKTLSDEEEKLKKENEELEAKIKENEQKKAEEEKKKAEEEAKALSVSGTPYFGADGLLVERHTAASQNVINLLLGIPNHSNGAYYHQATGLDSYIDQLSVEEAVNVIHRIEGAGFGQTGAGYAGFDTPESHQVFLRQQVQGRFGGDVRQLLKKWGTYSYGGY